MKRYSGFEFALLSICLCFGLIACTPFGGFKPPPKWWTYFEGNGASEEEIRIALLECGSDVPGDFFEFPKLPEKFLRDDARSEGVSVAQCMINSGFRFNGRTPICARWIDTRTGLQAPPYPACMPGWVPTPRSVENRLNSAYCKTYPETRLCQPVVVSEAEWNEIHKDEIAARRKMLDEVKRQGYSTSVGTGEAKYCREEARKNASQTEAKFYFEKCLKEKFKVWNPFLSFE
jgi:hypothetical protein